MATTYYTDIQKLYVAYFNRPADTAGLAYWEPIVEAAKGSTAAVSANFAASAEYKAAYSGMSSADTVNTVYMNLFGRAADDAGKAYWAGLLDAKKVTIDQVVTAIAGGAQGSDATIYANKVTAASAFTAALTANDSYNTAAAAVAAKSFLNGVTDNASLANAIDPVMLQVAISKVDVAANPFSLQTGVDALNAATTARANFLDAADGKLDGHTSATAEADINADVNAATAGSSAKAVADIVSANVALNEASLYASSTTNDAVKAALLAEAQTHLQSVLTTAQQAVAADNAAIAAVPGLGAAITALNNANATLTTATTAQTAAHTNVSVAFAAYNVQNSGAPLTAPTSGTYTDQVAAVNTVITADSSGKLSLASGVTETNHPGVTALLNALVAEKTADTAQSTANTAQVSAQHIVDFLDGSPTYEQDLKAIASAMTINKIAAGTLPTEAQINAELAGLLAAKTAAVGGPNEAATAAAYTSFNTLVSNAQAANTSNDLSAKLALDTGHVTDAQTAISDLNSALADLATANTTKAQLDAINGQLTAAQGAFTAHGLAQPNMLTAGGPVTATPAADIYVVGTGSKSSQIAGFDTNGIDSLYIGSKITALGTDLSKGNDAALEAFITKNTGGDVVISVETKAFGSHESAPAADLVQITLTGVTDVTKVHLNNGIITVSA